MKKNSFVEIIGIIVYTIIIVCFAVSISGLCMWGIGNLVIHVFKINYEWTYLHGLTTTIVLMILAGLFKNNSRKGE